jgi:hypothetical protein
MAFTMSWQFIAVATGIVIVYYDHRLQIANELEWSEETSATWDQAFLAGQNSIAMGADSVCDGLLGLAPRLPRVTAGSAFYTLLDSWKAQLRERTGRRAEYLGHALLVWRKLHNFHPDLSGDVELPGLPEGVGTVLLTRDQARSLTRELNRRQLKGDLCVQLMNPLVDRLPGTALDLSVNGSPIHLEADRYGRRNYDPAPVLFLLTISWLFQSTSPSGPFVPASVAAPVSGLCVMAALWAHRRLAEEGPRARPAILHVAILIGLFYTVAGTTTMRHAVAGGNQQFPMAAGLGGLGLLAGFYWSALDQHVRRRVILGALMICALGLQLTPGPLQLRGVLLVILWQGAGFLPAKRFGDVYHSAGAALDSQLQEERELLKERSFDEGRRWVIELVTLALLDAQDLFDAVRPTLPSDLEADTERRLKEVEARLVQLSAAVE